MNIEGFNECYRIVDTVDFVVDRTEVRIEVKDALHSSESHFCATVYKLNEDDIWTKWSDFPWTRRDSAESVLVQAIGFLRDRTGLR